ncbi:MAG TPA: hypothetical protein VMM92_15160 [Thermoanaerobaculia bacterium]|nr:hypothetical protein [Thermoanaerobaculia bacterium]
MLVNTANGPKNEAPRGGDGSLLLWFLLFAFGGGGLAVYYSRIGYFPDIEWHEALSYLGLLSITGGWLVVLFSLLLFVPGFFWSEFLIFDPTILDTMCYVRNERPEMCLRTAGAYVVMPFLGVITVSDLLLTQGLWVTLGGAAAATIGACIYLWRKLDGYVRKANLVDNDRKSRLVKYTLAFATTAFLGVFSLVVIKSLMNYPAFSWMTLICPLVVALSNTLVAMQFRLSKVSAMLISATAAVILLGIGETRLRDPLMNAELTQPTASRPEKKEQITLFDSIWRSFGFCGQPKTTLVIDDKGCSTLVGQDLKVTGLRAGLCKVSDVAILSRLGNNIFFKMQERRISLPKERVVSWSVPADLQTACP